MALDLAEQVLAAFQASLTTPAISGIGTRVARDREDSYGETEFAEGEGAVNIKPADEQSKIFGERADDNELAVDVEIIVRSQQGDVPWTTRANAFAVLVHARLTTYASWPAAVVTEEDGLARIRKISRNWGGDEMGRTPGRLTIKYAIRYLSQARALDRAP